MASHLENDDHVQEERPTMVRRITHHHVRPQVMLQSRHQVLTRRTVVRRPAKSSWKIPGKRGSNGRLRNLHHSSTQPHKRTPSTAHGTRTTFTHPDIEKVTHVFVRDDTTRKALQTPYTGPHEIVRRETDRIYIIRRNGRDIATSTERIKPAYLPNEDATFPAEHPPENADIQARNTSNTKTVIFASTTQTLRGKYCGDTATAAQARETTNEHRTRHAIVHGTEEGKRLQENSLLLPASRTVGSSQRKSSR